MTIAGRTQMLIHRYSLRESIERVSELGFKGVEICLEDHHFDVVPGLLEPRLVEEVAETCRACAFETVSLGCHSDYLYNDFNYEFLKKAIPKAADFGSELFIIGAVGRRVIQSDQPGWDEEWLRMKERFRVLLKIAEDHGILLAPEPEIHCILRTSEDLLLLMDEFDSPALRVNLDLGHAFLTDPEPLESIRRFGHRIAHVHIENMYRGWHNHQLPSHGDMDLSIYLKTLASVGFAGNLSLDLYNYDLEKVAAPCLKYLNDLLNEEGIG